MSESITETLTKRASLEQTTVDGIRAQIARNALDLQPSQLANLADAVVQYAERQNTYRIAASIPDEYRREWLLDELCAFPDDTGSGRGNDRRRIAADAKLDVLREVRQLMDRRQ
jgi:hypothetical protein